MSVVDNGIYVDGKRALSPPSLDKAFSALRSCPDSGRSFAWIGMLRPGPDEIDAVAREFDLHELAVEDTLSGHQRRSWSATATRPSWCCGPPVTWTRTR
jgi:magnesium transporter